MKRFLLKSYLACRLPLIRLLAHLDAGRKPEGEPRRILVIRLDRMGDLVLTIPLVESLRAKFPSARIDLCVRPFLKELAEMIVPGGSVIPFEGRRTFARVAGSGYDMAVDPVCTWRLDSAMLALVSGAPVRLGFSGGGRERLFTCSAGEAEFPGKHTAELGVELLRKYGIDAEYGIPRLARPEMPAAGTVRVAIHTGGYYPSQRWPDAKFGCLAKKIMKAFSCEVVFIGAPAERRRLYRLAKKSGPGCRVLTVGFRELAAFLSSCRLFIGNNSGPLHMAAALGLPTVSVMGPTDPRLFSPLGKGHMVLRRQLGCSPCGKGRCAGHRCLEDITVDEVFAAARHSMKANDGTG